MNAAVAAAQNVPEVMHSLDPSANATDGNATATATARNFTVDASVWQAAESLQRQERFQVPALENI